MEVPCVWCAGVGRVTAGESRHWTLLKTWPEHQCPDCGGLGRRPASQPRLWPKK